MSQAIEKNRFLVGRDAGCGFVQDQYPYAERQEPQELELLAFADRERLNPTFRAEVEIEGAAEVQETAFKALAIQAQRSGLPQYKIVQNRKLLEIQRVLIEHPDTGPDRLCRAGE